MKELTQLFERMVYGSGNTEKEAMKDRNKNLKELLKCIRKKNVKLNKETIKLERSCIFLTYFKNVVIKADNRKIKVYTLRKN